MTIAQQIGQASVDLATRSGRADFIRTCFALLRHRGPLEASRAAASERENSRVQGILKSVVTGSTISDWGAVADYNVVQAAFQESLRDQSVFDATLNGGMIRAPLRSRGFSITTGISGSVINERAVKVISTLALATQLLELRKAAAIIVVSKELGDYPGAARLFGDELVKGVVAATDVLFLSSLVAATTPVASAGSSLANITTDLSVLLSAITTSATSKLYYVTSPTNMKKLMLKANTIGAPAFPSLGPTGGEILPGVTAIASDSVPSGTAIAFDATSIVGNSDKILPGKSEQSTLQLESSNPDSPPVASTVTVSLWQSDLLALRVERFFGFTVMRASGVASLSGVAY